MTRLPFMRRHGRARSKYLLTARQRVVIENVAGALPLDARERFFNDVSRKLTINKGADGHVSDLMIGRIIEAVLATREAS